MKFDMNNTLPTLYIPYPQCEHCGTEVVIEDGYARCEECLIWWSQISEDSPAQPDGNLDGTDVPCGITTKQREAYDHAGKHWEFGPPQPCILPSGHESKEHLCPVTVTVTTTELVSGNGRLV